MAKNFLLHAKANEAGSTDYFFPLKITAPEDEEYARLFGFEIGRTWIGFDKAKAAMIPCKRTARDRHGKEIFVDTPEDVQLDRYNCLMREIRAEQDRKRHDGRCSFFNEQGLRERCPYRVANPDYDPNIPHNPRTNPKTVRKSCEGCEFSPFKAAHDMASFSELESVDDSGDAVPYEPASPWDYYEDDRYRELAARVKSVVHKHKPRLDGLVDLLAAGLTQADAARALGKAPSTINSQHKVLRRLLETLPELQELLRSN